MNEKLTQVVPVRGDWYVLEPLLDEDDWVREFRYDPVVAWLVEVIETQAGPDDESADVFTITTPVTTGILQDPEILWRPDGKVEFIEGPIFDNQEAALEHVNRMRRE